MSRTWKKTVATGAMLVAASVAVQNVSEAAGRISERLATSRASSAKEKPAGHEADSDAKSGNGLFANRASAGKGLTSRAAKRKEVPAHAKEALSNAGALEIDLGETVETFDGPALTPPGVPPAEGEAPIPAPRTNPRRSPVLKRGEAPKPDATPHVDEPKLLGNRGVR